MLLFDWRMWARPEQLAPEGTWTVWFVQAGRGFGKTRSGAEWIREEKDRTGRLALVGPTAGDARDVMIEGESGLLAISPPWDRPRYEPSKRRLTWRNGATATVFSAEEPERLRGPQAGAAWCDEIGTWRFARDAWDNLTFGMRLGTRPRVCVTSTPRNTPVVRELVDDPDTVVTSGSTYENLENLAPAFIKRVVRRYEGTRLGRQELRGELLLDVPGALWKRDRLEELRVRTVPALVRIAIAIDPAVTATEDSDETGIVIAGKGVDGHLYILGDKSGIYSPAEWADVAIAEYQARKADRIIGEVNNGGDLIEANLRGHPKGKLVAYRSVHASRGKRVRAEPVSALYEQGLAHHFGAFPHLEDQMCSFTADGYEGSPDRVDALVWVATELMLGDSQETPYVAIGGIGQTSKWR